MQISFQISLICSISLIVCKFLGLHWWAEGHLVSVSAGTSSAVGGGAAVRSSHDQR